MRRSLSNVLSAFRPSTATPNQGALAQTDYLSTDTQDWYQPWEYDNDVNFKMLVTEFYMVTSTTVVFCPIHGFHVVRVTVIVMVAYWI